MALGELPFSPPEISSGSYYPSPTSHGLVEPSSSLLTGHKLNGSNYLQWSSLILLFIRGKGHEEYLTSEFLPLSVNDPNAQIWKIDNSIVMSWLVSSMTPDIAENFLLYETVQEIWETARKLYSSKENISTIFEIESTLHELRQGELNVIQYYNLLSRSWQQLDAFEERR